MDRLTAALKPAPARPVRVLQYGEGNFLRAFVDYMLDIANEQGSTDLGVALVKPIPMGSLDAFHRQDCRYTVILRGLTDGKPTTATRLVTSVVDAVDPYREYEKYAAFARLDSLRFVVSNTTEAGIVLDEGDRIDLCPPKTYPGKLAKLLYERAEAFDYAPDKGLVILPVELIDDNGALLKRCVAALARLWKLGERFETWLDEACVFASTLVDRIVTGYPKEEEAALWQALGYEDRLMVTAEPFALWVIESEKDLSEELPLPRCGLPVVFTDDQKPFKQRKVRILNGAHTAIVPAAFLCRHDFVLDAMGDPMIKKFMRDLLYDEVIPTLSLPLEDLTAFAQAVTARFENPFIKHPLLSICLNSVSKWRARCMPSLLGYVACKKALPPHLVFSLAALMALYSDGKISDGALWCARDAQPYKLMDDEPVLRFFAENSGRPADEFVRAFLCDARFFGQDLTRVEGLAERVAESLESIRARGMRTAMAETFGGGE